MGHYENNIGAGDTATFVLAGGSYGVDAVASFGGGTVTLQRLAQDGVSFVAVPNCAFTVAGMVVQNIPAGTYRWHVATSTAVYTGVTRIPEV